MKKVIWVIVVLVILISGYFVMNREKEVLENQPIKIGVILPLTGSGSSIGEEVRNGIELARQKISSNIEILYEDNQTETKLNVNAAQKLISQNGVKLLITWTSAATESVAPIAEENKVVLLYGSSINGPASKYTYVFKNFASIEQDCGAIANYVKNNSVGMLGIVSDSTSGCISAFQDNGVNIVAETYSKGTTDFRTMLTKFKKSAPAFLVLRAWPADTEVIVRQIKEIGLEKTTILCPNLSLTKCDSKKTTEKYFDIYKNAVGTDFYIDTNNQEMKIFSDLYEEKYQMKPVADALYAYEDILILNQAIKTCSNRDFSDCVKNNLLNQTFRGVGEDLKFNNQKSIERSPTLLKFDGKSWNKI